MDVAFVFDKYLIYGWYSDGIRMVFGWFSDRVDIGFG
jgi:hypothetical protein